MKWVLAKDRLPQKTGTYFTRTVDTGRKRVVFYTACCGGANSLLKKHPWNMEWLDETPEKLISDCRP